MQTQVRETDMRRVYSIRPLSYHPRIARTYDQLLPFAFKRFSVRSAVRTLLPTLGYYAQRPAQPASSKPALFTMNILPPMMTVWHHLARKALGDAVDITIFDCSGTLDPAELPGARVQKFLNLYAATKCDEFLRYIAKNRRIGWLCDDDIFLLSPKALTVLERELRDPRTASVSFRPRNWWTFNIDGKRIEPSGSYCLALNREIFWEKEHLSLAPADGNTHVESRGGGRRYDTFDKANETLLRKGYRCAILPEAEREHCITGFSGMSGAVMLLSYFRTPEKTLRYYLDPPKKQWTGNVLPGTLHAMLAVCAIQECYVRLRGKPYPLPSLPPRAALEKIEREHRTYLHEGLDFTFMREAEERIKAAL
jgi:hypothetical protein